MAPPGLRAGRAPAPPPEAPPLPVASSRCRCRRCPHPGCRPPDKGLSVSTDGAPSRGTRPAAPSQDGSQCCLLQKTRSSSGSSDVGSARAGRGEGPPPLRTPVPNKSPFLPEPRVREAQRPGQRPVPLEPCPGYVPHTPVHTTALRGPLPCRSRGRTVDSGDALEEGPGTWHGQDEKPSDEIWAMGLRGDIPAPNRAALSRRAQTSDISS